MIRRFGWLVVCGLIFGSPALATQPGERLSADDLVFTVFGLAAGIYVPVDPDFNYSSCAVFPTPADLRCDLLTQSGFDAEGRQYGVRLGNSLVNPLLPRTEIWRTRSDGGTEMIAFLDPRPAQAGTFDDGRIERIAVDVVGGFIYGVLSTGCFPVNAPGCLYYGRANEIVKITGLKTLHDVLVTGANPGGTNGGGSKPPLGQTKFAREPNGHRRPNSPHPGDHP